MVDGRRPLRTVVPANVRALLRQSGQTQAQLAAAMRIHFSTMSRRMLGKDRFALDDLDVIADHFGITVAQLVSVDYEREPYVRWSNG